MNKLTKNNEGGEGVCEPTLSELIEACGESIMYLHRIIAIKDNEPNLRWVAFDRKLNGVYGSTPEEAVAQLWLALQQK